MDAQEVLTVITVVSTTVSTPPAKAWAAKAPRPTMMMGGACMVAVLLYLLWEELY